jgi:vacuolar-type H+-ATPase subunit I/STV1
VCSSDLEGKWEYKVSKNDAWKFAPKIGNDSDKYFYTSKKHIPATLETIKKSFVFGFISLMLGIILLYYNEINGIWFETISPMLSEWVLACIIIMLIIYAFIFITYKIWNEKIS